MEARIVPKPQAKVSSAGKVNQLERLSRMTTIVCWDLAPNVNCDQVRNIFQGIRCVVDISFNSRRRRAVVQFATATDAQAALYQLTGCCLMERRIKFAWFDKSGCDLDSYKLPHMELLPDRVPRTVYVEGFDTSAGIKQIRRMLKTRFDPAGRRGGKIITPKNPEGTSIGKAFVCFRRFRDFRAALKRDGLNLGDGHRLRVAKWIEVLSFPWSPDKERGGGADAPNWSTPSTGERIVFED